MLDPSFIRDHVEDVRNGLRNRGLDADKTLEEIATLLELKDENPFKIRAYQNAARSIEAFGASLSELQNQETLEKIPGVGKAIAAKISELALTGGLKFLDELRAEFPLAILELFSIPGLGAKKIKALYDKLKVSSIADLQAACESGRVAELPGFGATTQTKICNAIANRVKHAGSFQFGEIAIINRMRVPCQLLCIAQCRLFLLCEPRKVFTLQQLPVLCGHARSLR